MPPPPDLVGRTTRFETRSTSASPRLCVWRAYAQAGLTAAIQRQPPTTSRPRKLDGRQEAHLVTLACSSPPPGQARWTLRLLTDRFVELEGALVSDETVRRVLKKTI